MHFLGGGRISKVEIGGGKKIYKIELYLPVHGDFVIGVFGHQGYLVREFVVRDFVMEDYVTEGIKLWGLCH